MKRADPKEDDQAETAPAKNQLGYLPLQEDLEESVMCTPFQLIASKDIRLLYITLDTTAYYEDNDPWEKMSHYKGKFNRTWIKPFLRL